MAKNKHSKNRTPAENNSSDLRTRKKEAVLGGEKKKGGPMPVILAVILVAAVAGGYTLYTRQTTPAPVASSSAGSAVPANSEAVAPGTAAYPVSLFEDGQAKYFEFKDGERTIRYFVIKSADGVIRAAFDACDVCWPAGKGYYQDGDDMVCRNCGRRFASNLVNEVQGGCNPAPLKRSVDNGMLVIRPEDIRSGAGYFKL
jgi:uncharacterized membrane protein